MKAIHLFTDASTTAFGIAIYGISDNDGKKQGRLLFAKSRPLKSSLTIPRAELVTAWSVLQFFRKELELSALPVDRLEMNWPRSNPNTKLPIFVRNRVDEVQALNLSFRYVPSEENPADLASRGVSKVWREGLIEEEDHWPIQETQKDHMVESHS
uniref:RT_RNaseH_2 domain-containing protein n=1 Tax=Syphacia muris TaxID=451379 RepID=A0A0N5AC55_9BILA